MDKKKLEYFKELLLNRRNELLEEMGVMQESANSTSKDASGVDATYSTHMADQGTDAQEREKAFYYQSRDSRHLKLLDDALERIEKGEYGICISCGKPIPEKRLEAVLITQHCVPCKMEEKR